MSETTAGTKPGSDLTILAFRRSLTGFEEIFVSKTWGSPWLTLYKENEPDFVRAMVSVDLKRKGEPDPYQASLKLTSGECEDYFADGPEDGDDEPGEAS